MSPLAGRGPVLLTGATGFVGSAVMRSLLRAGYPVRALVRNPGLLPSTPGVEPWAGDLRDRPGLEDAAHGCAAIVHCAADYRLWLPRGDLNRMVAVNVGGTANLLVAARAQRVPRVVHCSTVGTLAFERAGRVLSEPDRAPSAATLAGPYKRTKWAAERLALAASGDGLEVVVVQPSTPVGAGDRRPTPTGAVIRDCLRGRLPALVETGLNLVDVEAVGQGHVLALERGRPGRSYILGDRNLSLRQFLGEVARLGGVRAPRWLIPLPLALAAAAASEAWARIGGGPAAVPLTAVRMASHAMYVDPSRARSELGWDPGNLERALAEAVREQGAA